MKKVGKKKPSKKKRLLEKQRETIKNLKIVFAALLKWISCHFNRKAEFRSLEFRPLETVSTCKSIEFQRVKFKKNTCNNIMYSLGIGPNKSRFDKVSLNVASCGLILDYMTFPSLKCQWRN